MDTFFRKALCHALLVMAACLAVWSDAHSALGLTSEEINTIEVFQKVAPSVVNITTAPCDPEYFFCPLPTSSMSGSGIILKDDGTIVTNHHVVAEAQDIEVTLADGRRFAARILATSPHHDIAVLRVEANGHPLTPIVLGDSDRLEVGGKVLAVGNPFGLGHTLTVGTISMTGRDIRDGARVLRNLIQTDASINPGNSGGALVNSKGELVGMNTAILSPTGTSVGIGFAIPVNRIKKVTPGLIHGWSAWLGWILALIVVYWVLRRIHRARISPPGQ